jgi:hypothetical protein
LIIFEIAAHRGLGRRYAYNVAVPATAKQAPINFGRATDDGGQIEDKHEIRSTKFETNSNYQNKKFKTRFFTPFRMTRIWIPACAGMTVF